MNVPITKDLIEPKLTSNIFFVDSIEEFEKLELKLNETRLAFDNYRQCCYIKSRDKLGEYSPIKIYFYDDFVDRAQRLEREEFVKKCKEAGLDEFKTEVSIKFFIEGKKPQDVWLWALSEKKKDIEWDSIKTMKYRLKKKLFPEMVKRKQKVNNL